MCERLEIKVGSRVRSYDFPGVREDCYVEGSVAEIEDGYAYVAVEKRVHSGAECESFPPKIKASLGKSFFKEVFGVVLLEGGAA